MKQPHLKVRDAALQHRQLSQRLARAQGGAGNGVVGHVGGDAGFLGQQRIQFAQQRAATGQGHAAVDDVG